MTLIITAPADEGIVQASARLLTLGDRPVEKPENRSVCVACRDANFTLAITGVALVQGRPTADWVLDELVRMKAGELGFLDIVGQLSQSLTTGVAAVPVGFTPPCGFDSLLRHHKQST